MGWRNSGRERCCCARFPWTSPRSRGRIASPAWPRIFRRAAIKAGWHTDPLEREALVRQVLGREDLKYCPHGRPVCIRLTKQQLERQFGRA